MVTENPETPLTLTFSPDEKSHTITVTTNLADPVFATHGKTKQEIEKARATYQSQASLFQNFIHLATYSNLKPDGEPPQRKATYDINDTDGALKALVRAATPERYNAYLSNLSQKRFDEFLAHAPQVPQLGRR